MHGKTSPLRHDSKGLFAGIPQDVPVTRYHSLAGAHPTLPDCLEVSAWSERGKGGSRTDPIIMGVRHRTYVVEGVQFHPESILTVEGKTMLKNFLRMKGGTWEEHPPPGQGAGPSNGTTEDEAAVVGSKSAKAGSILEEIYEHRRAAVASQMQVPSQRLSDLRALYELNLAPPLISFPARLRDSPYPLSLMAEIKRASPSKGVISLTCCAPAQARAYALAGASVISVLTEPEWFKGSIEDLRAVRQALEGFQNRPAVLRKDFVFDEYQILEARLAGADTVLLIVKMLDEDLLRRLYRYSVSLGMEPLVEVNNEAEMRVAVSLGAKVIGVNNRNLTSFDVDLGTTSRLADMATDAAFICALSGIASSKDVEAYRSNRVGAVLVGEALMRAADPAGFVRGLLGGDASRVGPGAPREPLLVKVCGIRTVDAARAAIEAGADLLGMILVKGRSRTVEQDVAVEISRTVHGSHKERPVGQHASRGAASADYFDHQASLVRWSPRPLLVGVFQDMPLSYIIDRQRELELDIVQLHGSEPVEWASLIPVPVIRSFAPSCPGIGRRGYHALPLLDAAGGGSGVQLDPSAIDGALRHDAGVRAFLAGGLTADNVKRVLDSLSPPIAGRVVGVDVSSGVEHDGAQSHDKIRAFVAAAKAI